MVKGGFGGGADPKKEALGSGKQQP
jgi:hypothetical protein